MKDRLPENVIEMVELRDRVSVFRNREHAGENPVKDAESLRVFSCHSFRRAGR